MTHSLRSKFKGRVTQAGHQREGSSTLRERHPMRRAIAGITVIAVAGVLTACSSSVQTSPAVDKKLTATVSGVEITTNAELAAKVPKAIREGGVLTAIQYNNAPSDTFVQDGKATGWGPDLGEAVATKLGLKWQPQVSGAFDTFIPGMQNGRFQTTWASLTVLPERLKIVDIVAVHKASTGFIVKDGSPLNIATPTDLCGISIAALAGSSFITQLNAVKDECAKAGLKAPDVRSFPGQADAQLAVQNGRMDAFATAKGQLAWLLRTEHSFKLAPLDYQPNLEGVGVAKQTNLAPLIAEAIDAMIADGSYAKILAKWDIDFGLLDKAEVNPS